MEERETRCGKFISIVRFSDHLKTCKDCLNREEFYKNELEDINIYEKREKEIQNNLRISNILTKAQTQVNEILKTTLIDPKAAKDLEKFWAKYKSKFLKAKEEEENQAQTEQPPTGVGTKAIFPTPIPDQAEEIQPSTISLLSKIKRKYTDLPKKTRVAFWTIASIILDVLSLLMTGFSFYFSILHVCGFPIPDIPYLLE